MNRKLTWEHLRLQDRIAQGVRVLLVGINPGVRSAQTGHHFAGPSNRFWKLLFDSGLVPERLSYLDDVRLPRPQAELTDDTFSYSLNVNFNEKK